MHGVCPAVLTLFGLFTQILFGEECKLQSLHYAASSSFFLLGPNILFSTLLSDTLNHCSSHTVRDQVSQLHKTMSKI